MHKRVVFTGGGTAGHVFPGLAVIETLGEHGYRDVVWIGSSGGMERGLVENHGIRFYGVPAGKLRRYLSIRNVIDVAKVFLGFVSALVLLLRLKPAAVFSKGGYVTVPVMAAAKLLGVPSVTHESDSDPGLATRINALFVDRVLLSFDASTAYFSPRQRDRCVIVGNPVRKDLAAGSAAKGRAFLGFGEERPVVFFVGGSLGSAQINRLVGDMLDGLLGQCYVVHQRGAHAAPRENGNGYVSLEFIGGEYADVLAAADLVVCRAGAGTLWELALTKKPAVLIPLPSSGSRGDQERNARRFAERGAAVVFEEADAVADRLEAEIVRLLENPKERTRMGTAASSFDASGAADRIAAMLANVMEGRGWTL
ncbi:MAG: undecaprenyldiphospho-muramoylpentapeptide beta-N-acetylglucosaminyltransferase [Spirochaetota bacterium]